MDQTLKQIASRNAGAWLETRDAELRADRAAGQRAATNDMALLLRRFQDFQDGLIGRAKAAILTLQSDLTAHGRDLHRQVEDLARERDSHIGQRVTDLREERQRVLHALDNTKGPMSAPYSRATLSGEEAEKALRAVRAEVNGRPLRRTLVGAYLPIMAALALVEVPVNRLAFELFFQEQPLISLALALVVGAVLIFFAHMVGTLIRRMEQQPARTSQQLRRGAGILLFAVLTGTMMYLLAGMRQLYVRLLESEQGSASLGAMVEALTRGGTASTIANVANQQLGPAGWTLLILNLVLFVFGATAAFLRHDPHPDYEAAWRAHERSRRQVMKLRARYEALVHTRQKTFDEQMAALDQLMRETQAKHDELVARQAAIAPFFAETGKRIANTVRNRSLAFLEGAIGAMPEGKREGSLAEVRALTEPEVFRRITEDLVRAA